jgi:hypothetical protein
LTGELSKYGDVRADGESVLDYVWWTGGSPIPDERYVRVGFIDEEREFVIERSEFDEPDKDTLSQVLDRLVDRRLAPNNPVRQLCSSAIAAGVARTERVPRRIWSTRNF